LKQDSLTLKEYKPLLSVPQKSKMAAKEGYVGQNLKFDLQGGGCRSFLAVTRFYDAWWSKIEIRHVSAVPLR